MLHAAHDKSSFMPDGAEGTRSKQQDKRTAGASRLLLVAEADQGG